MDSVRVEAFNISKLVQLSKLSLSCSFNHFSMNAFIGSINILSCKRLMLSHYLT